MSSYFRVRLSYVSTLLEDDVTDLSFEHGATGVTEALAMVGYGLPFLVIAFPLALLWRALWRWATRRRDA